MQYLVIIIKIMTFSFFISTSAFSLEQKTEKQLEQEDKIVTSKNENICQIKYVSEVFNQQRIFSSVNINSKQRRVAERKIDAGRKKYDVTGSYCDAYKEILTFKPESLDRIPGDAQFKEPK